MTTNKYFNCSICIRVHDVFDIRHTKGVISHDSK